MTLNFFGKILSKENFLWLLALCLVFPAYIDFFISKLPVAQGLAYLTYLLPVIILITNKKINLPIRFIIFWIIFLFLWIVPSAINLFLPGPRPDLIFMHALIAKLFFLTTIVVLSISFFQSFTNNDFNNLCYLIFLALLPMLLLIFFECIDLSLSCNFCRVYPFNNLPFFVSEIFFIFIIFSLILKSQPWKFLIILGSFIGLIMVEGRAAILASVIAILAMKFFSLKKHTQKKIFIFFILIVFILIYLIHGGYFHYFLEDTFLYRQQGNLETFSARLHMYKYAVESIIQNPFIGIGFEVTPNYDHFTNHNTNTIHNIFLRLATENGLILAFIVVGIFVKAFYKLIKFQMNYELAFFLSFFIYNSLSTRHLSLNLMNVFLYMIVVKALMLKPTKKFTPSQ